MRTLTLFPSYQYTKIKKNVELIYFYSVKYSELDKMIISYLSYSIFGIDIPPETSFVAGVTV